MPSLLSFFLQRLSNRRYYSPPSDFPILNARSIASSAPGKVILFGEHAVVHGEPAIAASLSDLCVDVLLSPTTLTIIRIGLESLDRYAEIDTEQLTVNRSELHVPPESDSTQILERLIRSVYHDNNSSTDHSVVISALIPLLYLVSVMLPEDMIHSGLDIVVRSHNLPIRAGLGSSAAFSTALAASLFQLSSYAERKLGVPDSESLSMIAQFAFYSEQLLHGTPSGVDNAVSAQGGVILFQRESIRSSDSNSPLPPPIVKRLPDLMLPSTMMLIDTHISRSTKELVDHVKDQLNHHRGSARIILRAMGQIASEFAASTVCSTTPLPFSSTNSVADETLAAQQQQHQHFCEQLRMNQHLLASVGVSHPVIDKVCAAVAQVGKGTLVCAAAKLTGAGGGGCIIVAYQPASASTTIERALRSQFPSLTFLHTQVGGSGVKWISPSEFVLSRRSRSMQHERSTQDAKVTRRATAVISTTVITIIGTLFATKYFNRSSSSSLRHLHWQ